VLKPGFIRKTDKKRVKTMPKAKAAKRILSVTIKHMMDDSPDTSYLGEYSTKRTSEYSIDRRHSEDCASVNPQAIEAKEKLERVASWVNELRTGNGSEEQDAEWESLDAATECLEQLQEDVIECDCGGHQVSSRECEYFNPSDNYQGCEPDEIRKYVRQDYDRMESLNNEDWYYLGIRADAEIGIPIHSSYVVEDKSGKRTEHTYQTQKITSGGLWGIESDSDASYIKSVETDELADLKTQLLALGFSKRAIAGAFKNIKEVQS
jgi:hypothetical protein